MSNIDDGGGYGKPRQKHYLISSTIFSEEGSLLMRASVRRCFQHLCMIYQFEVLPYLQIYQIIVFMFREKAIN